MHNLDSKHHCDSHQHDSHIDANERLALAKAHCRERNARFTPLREDVYKLIVQADRPMGAYDLIDALQNRRRTDTGIKQLNVAPPTVYRSLDFLLSEGLIHQLSSINAYVPCCHPRDNHVAAFLICQVCKKVKECSNTPVDALIDFAATDAQFAVQYSVIELKGICRDCQST